MSVIRNVLISIVLLLLFGWAMIEFYYASIDLSDYFSDSNGSTMFEMNITPIVLFIALGCIIYFIKKAKKQNKVWTKALLLPKEFAESDEREKQITSQACRTAYISLMYSFPIITALMLLYPFVSESMPYYPIVIFLLLPLTQVVSYLVSWQRNY